MPRGVTSVLQLSSNLSLASCQEALTCMSAKQTWACKAVSRALSYLSLGCTHGSGRRGMRRCGFCRPCHGTMQDGPHQQVRLVPEESGGVQVIHPDCHGCEQGRTSALKSLATAWHCEMKIWFP